MDKQEAIEVLKAKLSEYRSSSYSQFAVKIDGGDHHEITGPSGAEYQIEVQFFWDDKPNGDIPACRGKKLKCDHRAMLELFKQTTLETALTQAASLATTA